MGKTTTLHVHHVFLYISLPSLHDYDVKMHNFTFVENVNTRQQLYFSFPEPPEKNCQRLTNWTRWNKRDKVWSSTTSLFKWRFRSRRRRCCLSTLLLFPKVPHLIPCIFGLTRGKTRKSAVDLRQPKLTRFRKDYPKKSLQMPTISLRHEKSSYLGN